MSARFVSLPPDREPRVNALVLREGRLPNPARDNEVLVNEAFAEANRLAPGAQLGALIYGKRREVEIVGIASSPEFVFAVAPGALLPEPDRFGVVWMGREALGRAFDRDGAFNDVQMRLEPDANQREVAAQVDALLARYRWSRRLRPRPHAFGTVPGGRADVAAHHGNDPAAVLPRGRRVPPQRRAVTPRGHGAVEHRPDEILRLQRYDHRHPLREVRAGVRAARRAARHGWAAAGSAA